MASVSEMLFHKRTKEAIGARLLNTRLAVNATQADWVAKYGVLASSLSQWENGRFYPPLAFLIMVCEDNQLTLDWFYRGVLTGVPASFSQTIVSADQERPGRRRAAVSAEPASD